MAIYLNNKLVKSSNFAAGECYLKLDASSSEVANILAILTSSDLIIQLMLTVDAVRRIDPQAIINLIIPYFPYARHDRVYDLGEPLGLRVMANIINSLKCNSVTIFDPHSDTTPALLDNAKVIRQIELIIKSGLIEQINKNKLEIISPDIGAERKIKELERMLETEAIKATKTRNSITGEVESAHVYGEVKGKNLIIIDDICDGGSTFIELAKVLKDKGANDLYLYVTHGIFSKGLNTLKKYFKHIYCYHSLVNQFAEEDEFLTKLGNAQYEIEPNNSNRFL